MRFIRFRINFTSSSFWFYFVFSFSLSTRNCKYYVILRPYTVKNLFLIIFNYSSSFWHCCFLFPILIRMYLFLILLLSSFLSSSTIDFSSLYLEEPLPYNYKNLFLIILYCCFLFLIIFYYCFLFLVLIRITGSGSYVIRSKC